MPRLSEVCEPLRLLTMKDVERHWTELQEQAFNKLKWLVTEAPVLKYFDPKEELTLQSAASDTGLGAVLTQNGQPIAFVSRALSDAVCPCLIRYAQIEKGLLAVVFGLEKFHQYTYGRSVTVQSDHKPLEVIVKKPVYKAPNRLQRLLLRLLVYDVNLLYRRGSQMELADTSSRAYPPPVRLFALDFYHRQDIDSRPAVHMKAIWLSFQDHCCVNFFCVSTMFDCTDRIGSC